MAVHYARSHPMLILHGTYHWGRRLVAYRNDYCLACDAPRLAFQHRTFDALHVFFIPILPLGLWKRWRCSVCGQDPHERTRTRKSMKWVGVVALVFFTLPAFFVSPAEKPEDFYWIWGFRIGGPIAILWAIWATLRSPSDENLKERLRLVSPIMDATCPVCDIMLMPTEPAWQCPNCGMRRRALPAA
jgi:hypothetical protein